MDNESIQPDMTHVDARGAVDLGASQSPGGADRSGASTQAAGAGTGDSVAVTIDAPLIVDAGEQDVQQVLATSRTAPVMMLLWSPNSLESRAGVETMEDLAREYAGRFQLVKVDIDAAPQLAATLQVQVVPLLVAFIGGQPAPMFQGALQAAQVKAGIDEVLSVAERMGVTGRLAVDAEDVKAPTPPEHIPALEAEAAGDLEGARDHWARIIDLNPRDEEAKSHLARVRLLLRSREEATAGSADTPVARADALFAAGRQAEAFELLLTVIADTRGDEREDARVRILDLFRVAGNTDEVRAARRRLSTLLMV